jgi:hypothetical protein
MSSFRATETGWQIAPERKKRVRVTYEMPMSKFYERYGGGQAPPRSAPQQLNRMADYMMSGRGAYKRFRKLRSGGLRIGPGLGRRRRSRVMRGRGLYLGGRGGFWGDAWNHLRGGAVEGMKQGLWGHAGRALLPAVEAMGLGSYVTKSNALVNGGGDNVVPSFTRTTDDDSVVISSKEFVTDVYAPSTAGAFQVQQFALNPAIALTFPWLSQIAANYEEYEFGQLLFTYKTNVTDFVSTNGQVGTVIMATQYNSDQPPFQSKTEMMHYAGCGDSKTTENLMSGVECDPTKSSGAPGKFIRAGPVPQGEDNKQYDLGTFNLAMANCPALFADQAMGELHVSYTVRLRKQRFYSTQGKAIMRDAWVAHSPTLGTGVAPSAMVVGVANQNRINGDLSYNAVAGSWQYTFPAGIGGTYKIRVLAKDYGSGVGGSYITIAPIAQTIATITDTPDMFSGSAWTAKHTSVSSSAQGFTESTEAHYLVQTPASAGSTTDNTVDIIFRDIHGAVTAQLESFQIDVEAYNVAFNQPTTGNMVVDNSATGLTEAWP